MRIVKACILAALAAAAALVSPADARRLLQDGALEAHVLEGDWCGETIYVEIRSPTRDSFAGDAFQIRRMTAILTNILPFECPEARRMTLVGSVGGAAVWQGTASVADGEVAAMPPPSPNALVPLDERTRVREIQQSLNALGYDAGAPDGLMGPATRSAIRAFQSDRGLLATGRPSPGVVTALRGQGSGQFAAPAPVTAGGAAQSGTFPSAFAQPLNAGPAGAPALMAVPTSSQTQALAAQGFETFEGRIVLPGLYLASERLKDVEFGPVLARMALAAAPEISQNRYAVFQLMNLLSLAERRQIISTAAPNQALQQQARLENLDYRITEQALTNLGFNEFQTLRILQGFRDAGQPRLIAEAPTPPIPVLIVCDNSVGDYDFANQRFDLGSFFGCDRINPGSQILQIDAHYSTDDFPEYLAVPTEEAEAFLATIGEEREVFVGVASTITGVALTDPANGRFDLIQEVEALILFQDETLQRELRRIDLGRPDTPASATGGVIVDPARLIVEDNAPSLARDVALLALAEAPDLLEDDRIAIAYADLLPEPDQRSLLTGAGLDYDATVGQAGSIQQAANRLMDEFGRHRVLAQFRSDYASLLLDAAPPLPIPLLWTCPVLFQAYDFDNGYFQFMRDLGRDCSWPQGSNEMPSIQVEHPIDLSGIPDHIPVPLEQAQTFKEAHLEPAPMEAWPQVGLELSIVGIREVVSDDNARQFRLEITTDGAVLFPAGDESRQSPIWRFDLKRKDPAVTSGAVAAPVAAVTLRQPDTMMLLMLKHGLWEPAEQQWRQWAGARARWESHGQNRDWPHFFDSVNTSSGDPATMIDPAMTLRFAEWTRQRAANLPETLIIGRGGSFTMRDEWRQDGRIPVFRGSSGSGNRNLAAKLAAPLGRLHVLGLAQDGTWPISFNEIAIVLPSAAEDFQIPFDPSAVRPNHSVAVEADVAVTGLRIVSDGREDRLVADATPTAGRLIDYETGAVVATAVFDASAVVAATPIPFPPEAYFPVLYAEMAGEDPLETVYAALSSGLDAFARRERARRLVAEAQAFDPGPDGVWAVGRLRFNDYDFATGSFPVYSVSLEAYGDGVENSVRLMPASSDLFAVAMPPDRAQAWQQANPSHPDYALRVRVRPVSPVDGWTMPAIGVEVLEVELLDEEEILTANDPSRIRYETSTESATPPVETAVLPPEESEAPAIAEASGGFDILGVGLGASMEEAVSTIAAEIGETVRYEARRVERIAATGGNMWDPFNEGVMLRTSDATQTIMIYHEPPLADGSVTAISRWIFYPEGEGPPAAAVRNLLIEKYGEPRETDELENHIYMRWTATDPAGEEQQCDGEASGLFYGNWALDRAPWIGPEGPLVTRDRSGTPVAAQTSEPGAFVADGFIGGMNDAEAHCPETLISLLILAPDGRTWQFLTALSNPSAIAGFVEGNRAAMIGETAETSVGEIDLKL